MPFVRFFSPLCTSFILTILLAGCGSGSGSSDDDTQTHTVASVSTTGGSLSPASRSVEAGQTTVFSVIPDPGSKTMSVTGCNGSLQGSTYTTGPVDADCTIQARFNPAFTLSNQGINGPVNAVALATDGSGDIYVAGRFSNYSNQSVAAILRFNSDGSLDPNFSASDPWLLTLPHSSYVAEVFAIALATDGSGDVYVGGDGFLMRLNSDGTEDTGFDSSPLYNGIVYSIAPAGDGSGDIYVAGSFTSIDATLVPYLARLNADGTIDTAFDPGTGPNATVNAIAVSTDGSNDIFVAGHFTSYDSLSSIQLARVNGDGSLDTAFSSGTGFPGGIVYALEISTDGSNDLYVGGVFGTYNGVSRSCLVRVNDDGTLDSGFDPGLGADASVLTLAVARDGSGDLYVGGEFVNFNGASARRIIRLHNDGALDSRFATGEGFDNVVNAIAVDASDNLYAGGVFASYHSNASSKFIKLDHFGAVAQVFSDNTGTNGTVYAVATATDNSGDVYIGGNFTGYNGVTSHYLVRLNPDGSVDSGFGIGDGFDGAVFTIVLANDNSGDLYVGGSFNRYNNQYFGGIVRLNSDGSVDSLFSPGTGVYGGTVFSIAEANDGSNDLYAGGYFSSYDATSRKNLVRINRDGSIDPGLVTTGSGFDYPVRAITPANDLSGDLYVGGEFTSYNTTPSNHVIRLNSDGSIDSAFNIGTGFNYNVYSLLTTDDHPGDIYVGGGFDTYQGAATNPLVRMNSDGTLDGAFSSGAAHPITIYAIALATDGSGDLYASGSFSFIQRFDSSGTADSSFLPGDSFDVHSYLYGIAPAGDQSNEIFVGGSFSFYRNTTAGGIISLNRDASVD